MSKSVFQQLVEQTCSNPNFKPSNNKSHKSPANGSSNQSGRSVTDPARSVPSKSNGNHSASHPPFNEKFETRNEKLAAARTAEANRAARCFHVKANGVQCKSPAMRGQPFCFFHEKFYNPVYDDSFPPLEDANSVQCAILQVLNGLKSKLITPLEARVYLYGLKAASINARSTNFDRPRASESQVTELPAFEHARLNAEAYVTPDLRSGAADQRSAVTQSPSASARKPPSPEVIPSEVEGSAFVLAKH